MITDKVKNKDSQKLPERPLLVMLCFFCTHSKYHFVFNIGWHFKTISWDKLGFTFLICTALSYRQYITFPVIFGNIKTASAYTHMLMYTLHKPLYNFTPQLCVILPKAKSSFEHYSVGIIWQKWSLTQSLRGSISLGEAL